MSYTVFARKYRPQTFEEVIGQLHISQTLINAINTGRISHAYLFCGSRGTGKTTTARIMAKCLNCETGVTAKPCGICTPCKEISRGMSMDVIEIDGASNRGIEDIRDLRERVMLAPNRKYRVYIIDEVHMLTPEAFNALLKTLEEPPAHVTFIFATTEPHKLPTTILSRCQRFDFRRISMQNILKQLQYICAEEEIQADADALLLIARAAQGGMRDAEGVLDQVIAYTGEKKIVREDVTMVLGMVPEEALISITNAIVNQNDNSVIELVNALINNGMDMSQLNRDIVLHLRNLLMIKIGCVEGVLDITKESKDVLKQQLEDSGISVEFILKAIECLREANEQMKYSHAQARMILETALVKLCRIRGEVPLSEIIDKLIHLEQRLSTSCPGFYAEMEEERAEAQRHRDTKIQSGILQSTELLAPTQFSSPLDASINLSLEKVLQAWPDIWEMINNERPAVASHLSCGRVSSLNDNILTIEFDSSFHKTGVDKLEYRELIESKIRENMGKPLKIKTVLAQEQGQNTISGTKKMPSIHPKSDPRVERVADMFEGNRV
ncbi:DNA polymerase III, subunit gamma and tau [Candidatus Desantisbacteria bacterium CG2_30_40_21]|uniref:DNA polymerase III subunit gamma/tau n=5 Tax=unclassified Candidatus Desantisiibacteriota TaxID=3106372 RepID=A0A2M7JBS3_9BACT|nr:MAG: DNA polymerase III, subunit gamma and tau [Candidatus Desantisbacteria bacterium CG2_30_40_21]PIP39843.1 MAG: DNA polymerase III subunit gamma/tau [Candidatus Desantisbacteria bacterium CG23_combo_of_CG06-09_8_20_14_all_40_23]PIX16862.1 MAG: DNA polymerase III subunit gamma/tau [Candidatus Desantisbacteria bacterium CG_4_8_14_3_um_filter_40_12]PIY18918.1 MAG: DNA polymerase III subunit gamma/tau [Candidatus Desantisbacteria bacterium CG_4_10_14_3_um_filter_40_18]PJB28811.1 MAG: DNA poly